MQLGIFTRTYASASIEQIFADMAAASLRCAQLNLSSAGLPSLPSSISDADIDRISAAAHKNGISISALSGTFNMIDPDEDALRRAIGQFRLQCQIAKELGAPIVTLCTGSRHSDKWTWHDDNLLESSWNLLLRTTETILKYAQESSVALGVEPEISNIINTPERAQRYLGTFNMPNLGIILDCANLFRPGQLQIQHAVLDEAFDLLDEHIILAHAKDFHDDGTLHFTGPGLGQIDFEYYLRKLRGAGYTGPVIMHGLSQDEIPDCLNHMTTVLQRGRL